MDKATLLAAMAPEVKIVNVEALGLDLSFKVMSGRARDAFQKAVEEGDKSVSNFESAIITATVVDDAGTPMFDASNLDSIRDWDSTVLSAVATIAMNINKIGAKAQEVAAVAPAAVEQTVSAAV
jgi:hypothetical protein